MPHSCGRPTSPRRRSLASYETHQVERPSHDQIAMLAYSYWEKRGRKDGSELEDWLRAERELIDGKGHRPRLVGSPAGVEVG